MQKLNKYLLFINLFFLQSYLLRFNIGPYPSNLQEVLIFLNLGTFVFSRTRIVVKQHLISGIFLTLTLISTFTGEIFSNIDLFRHLKFLFFAVVLSFLFLETFKTEVERLKGLRIMGLGALTFGVFSLIYNLLGFNVTHDYRLLGPLDSAVYLGFYLTPFFIFFAIRFFQGKEKIWPTLILGLLILATKSMGAIGGSFLVIGLYLFLNNFNKTAKIFTVLIGIIISALIFYTKILPTLQTEYSSLDERGEIWATAKELLKEPKTFIFGTGPSQFESHYQERVDEVIGKPPLDYNIIQPHNIFFLFWFHYGIFGVIFLFWLLYMLIFKWKKDIITFMLIYIFLHGLIDTPIYKNDMLIMLLILLNSKYSSKILTWQR